jgi:hypothetical protein
MTTLHLNLPDDLAAKLRAHAAAAAAAAAAAGRGSVDEYVQELLADQVELLDLARPRPATGGNGRG